MKVKDYSGHIVLQVLKERQRIYESKGFLGYHKNPPSERMVRIIEQTFWGFIPSQWNSSDGFAQLLRERDLATITRKKGKSS